MVKTIIIVDDEPSVIYTVKAGLESSETDYKVIGVDDGNKCLDMLKNDIKPDLILLDIMMPKISGWETLNRIKDNLSWRDIPIIFLSARTDRIAKDAGGFLADDYIGKPFTIDELKQKIEQILKK
jgi:CheY-like chemotaxis protein